MSGPGFALGHAAKLNIIADCLHNYVAGQTQLVDVPVPSCAVALGFLPEDVLRAAWKDPRLDVRWRGNKPDVALAGEAERPFVAMLEVAARFDVESDVSVNDEPMNKEGYAPPDFESQTAVEVPPPYRKVKKLRRKVKRLKRDLDSTLRLLRQADLLLESYRSIVRDLNV